MTIDETPPAEPATPAGPNPTRAEFSRVALSIAFTGKDDQAVPAALVDAFVVIATFEDNHASWNPYSTTQPEEGATPYNSFGPGGRYHVWNYASAEQGISAFLQTLGQPQFAGLRQTLRDAYDGKVGTDEILRVFADSAWTGITNDPGLYSGVVGEPSVVVDGEGGWPYPPTDAAPPTPPSPQAAEAGREAGALEAEAERITAEGGHPTAGVLKDVAAQLRTRADQLDTLAQEIDNSSA